MKAAVFLLSVILLSACNNSGKKKTSDTQNVSDKQQRVLTAIDNNDFSIKCEASGQEDDESTPQVNFLLESQKLKSTVLIATEPGCTEVRDRSGFNMPENAAFAMSGYYAGGGNYYYGLTKNDTLKVYRQYIEESHPDNDVNPAETKYVLFKTVVIKINESASVQTHNMK